MNRRVNFIVRVLLCLMFHLSIITALAQNIKRKCEVSCLIFLIPAKRNIPLNLSEILYAIEVDVSYRDERLKVVTADSFAMLLKKSRFILQKGIGKRIRMCFASYF